MEPFRFADVLFLLLVCAVTGGILALVNRKRFSVKKDTSETVEASEKTGTEAKIQASDEDN